MNIINQEMKRLDKIANVYHKCGNKEMKEMWKEKWHELVEMWHEDIEKCIQNLRRIG